MEPDITVLVPTRNEAANIGRFLASVPDDVPLIVVDSSTDDTADRIARSRLRRTEVIRRSVGIAEARQIAAERARTPWLVFTDADVAFAPDYFPLLAKVRSADVVYGRKHSDERFRRHYTAFGLGQGLAHRLGVPAASGSNLAMRRSTLAAIGGFDLRLTCNEDSEIAWRAKRAGFRVAFAPDLVVLATDHRRLERGAVRKAAHSLLRCALLYAGLMPERYRGGDWGYWSRCG